MSAPDTQQQTQQQIDSLVEQAARLRGYFDPEALAERIAELDRQAQAEGFWEDPAASAPILRERRAVERRLETYRRLAADSEELAAWRELVAEGLADADLDAFLERLEPRLRALELELKLSGPDDDKNALLAIHPGAGGTESQDWAEMLLRMYLRWAEARGYESELLYRLDGEEAGLKSAELAIRGANAYGYLQGESGVHRLVRISPYDAASRRHTSFASVDVYPEIDDDVEIELDDKDIRIDTYRASGAGGQHVNKTDSAVRMTHIPTNTVVSCQNERSQHKNRAMAMKMLRARLYDLEMKKRREAEAEREGLKKDIAWGSQIRSYVLHPYRMVKDHRTGTEVGNADRVLDGGIDPFIEAWLTEQIG
ncbi:MAG: peptide chain release factor 2 [Acidobacteriota bacterium]|nr:peptide chain release factor 2 [Acidobacteriota bacterium]